MTFEEIENIMKKYGSYTCIKKEYATYKADSSRNNKSKTVLEYVHILKKIDLSKNRGKISTINETANQTP